MVENLLCDLTKSLWHYHILNPTPENEEKVINMLSKDVVTIGTGKNELYLTRDQLIQSFGDLISQTVEIKFDVIDEWYECRKITSDSYLVYGGLWVKERNSSRCNVLVEMDTRFSVIYRRVNDFWEIMHLHHSISNPEQLKGEYYPKTLSQKAKEALELAEVFQKRSELDTMTGIYNNESYKYYAEKVMYNCPHAWLSILDLDYFKKINDTYGHLTGDNVLKLLADTLKKNFMEYGILGRIGGDEFSIFLPDPENSISFKDFQAKLDTMKQEYQSGLSELVSTKNCASFSIGISEYSANSPLPFLELLKKSDQELYAAKRKREAYPK